jgi:signal transduction histidine kinase
MLAEEQAALHRVATLVANGVEPEPLFDALAGEVEALFGADISAVVRFESDDTVTVMGAHGGPHSPGARAQLDPDYVVAAVQRTRQAASFDLDEREPPALARDWQVRSARATPVIVEGRLWGAITIASLDSAFAAGTDRRLADFSALFATAIANAQSREALAALAAEQASLRRVATLAAREVTPVEVLVTITEEAARALRTDAVGMLRFEPDGAATLVAQSDTPWDPPPLGTRLALDGENVLAWVRRTGQAARMDDWAQATGAVAALADVLGVTSAVATPITVEGRLWGAMVAVTNESEPLAGDIEARIGEFTELVATAIANAQSREALAELAEEQAALRRVAMLVAHDVPPSVIFAAVSEEAARVFDSGAGVLRYENDSEVVFLSVANVDIPVGTRWQFQEGMASAEVFRTGRPARVEEVDWSAVGGPVGAASLRIGTQSIVGCPIFVEDRLWGAMIVSSTRDRLPLGMEMRLERFTQLLATAIANAEASRARAQLAEEQGALHRVATLVAEGVDAQAIFDAVCQETCQLLDATTVTLSGSAPDGLEMTVAGWSRSETVAARSSLGAPIVVEGRPWGVLRAGTDRDEPFAAGTELRLARFAELIATAISNAAARSDLIASRARIVAAGDEARQRIERNLHDGTQQRLIAIGLDIQRVRATIPEDQQEARVGLERVEEDLQSVLEDLRELSRGLHPPLLSRRGLRSALRALARESPIPVEVEIDLPERPAAGLETAAYYVVSESLTNAIKHSQASAVSIKIETDHAGEPFAVGLDGRSRGVTLHATIADDGIGGADPSAGSGLMGLADRVDALGGRFDLDSPGGGGTRVKVELPLERR